MFGGCHLGDYCCRRADSLSKVMLMISCRNNNEVSDRKDKKEKLMKMTEEMERMIQTKTNYMSVHGGCNIGE